MNKEFLTISPNYEILRYGHDLIKRQTDDAHNRGTLSKFVIGCSDLIDPDKLPTWDNFKFESRQADDADIVVFVKNRETTILKG